MPPPAAPPTLIVLSGLPGTGKSTLAEALAREIGVPVFAKDWLEGQLVRCELTPARTDGLPLGAASYELLTMLAERQLSLGQSAILDSVASTVSIRDAWRTLAARVGARWVVIECICSDRALHRSRLGGRQRAIPGWHELAWDEVERVASYYAPWNEPRLILDAVDGLDQNLAQLLRYIGAGDPPSDRMGEP